MMTGDKTREIHRLPNQADQEEWHPHGVDYRRDSDRWSQQSNNLRRVFPSMAQQDID
jgi:hypothetical protein